VSATRRCDVALVEPLRCGSKGPAVAQCIGDVLVQLQVLQSFESGRAIRLGPQSADCLGFCTALAAEAGPAPTKSPQAPDCFSIQRRRLECAPPTHFFVLTAATGNAFCGSSEIAWPIRAPRPRASRLSPGRGPERKPCGSGDHHIGHRNSPQIAHGKCYFRGLFSQHHPGLQ
jgi:hypothetical protein